ncbi:cell envelope integrity protein TolA [Vibrio metschnikovii]|uniref:cell envelope integrity protein TolA n=1 Tax=Vibrio metschnikovii TaxID=28172 RepID=UPI001C2FAB99|nr:cell envelope integrity protein TolA [Vibrio metschnikovii]
MKAKKTLQRADKKPWLISAGLHVVLVVVLFWGADFTQSKPETPSAGAMMQAVVIDPSLIQQQAQQIRNQREAAAKQEQERLDKLRRETEQLERNRKAEEERIRQLKEQQAREAQAIREAERVRQQQEQQRQAAEEKARQEQERAAKAEAQRKATEQAAKKAEAERVAREAAAAKAEQERVAREKAAQAAQEKARQEQEVAKRAEQERIAKEKAAKEAAEKARQEQQRLARLDRERKEQDAAMNSIFSGLESEAQSISAARSQHIANEAQRWGAIYTQMIQQNLLLEDSFRGRQCRVNLRLIPTGADAIVGDVQVLNGDNRLCAATKRAVAKVGSFPLPTADEKDLIERLKNINLTVAPE